MKTSAFLIYASILLVFVYLFTMRIQVDEDPDMARVIPHTALLYLEQQEGAAALQRFAASRFGQQLAAIDFMAVAEEIGLPQGARTVIQQILSTCALAQKDATFQKVLGKKVAVALLPPLDSADAADVEVARNNAVVVMQPRNPKEWLDFTEKDRQFGEGTGAAGLQYGTHQIYRIQLGGQPVSLVFLKDFAVFSYNEKQLRRCIDAVDGELPALATVADLQAIRAQLTDPESFVYLPLQTIRPFLLASGEGLAFPGKDLLMRGVRATAGFNGLGYAAWRKAERIEEKIVIRFEEREVDAFAQDYVQTPPVQSAMLSLVSQDPMIYYWSNTLDFHNLSTYIEDEAKQDPRLAEFLRKLQATTGRDVSAALGLLAEEASMIVEQGPRDALFPFPLCICFLRMDKPEEFRSVVDKFLQSYDLPMNEEQYRSAWFRYWSRGPQDGLLPLYGFWQDYFFFGNSTMLLRRVLDSHDNNVSLEKIAAVRRIDPGLAEQNNSATYVNNVQLISMVENFLEVLGTFVAIEDREIAMKIKIVLKKIVNPLLDGAMMYTASASRSHITDHMLIVDSVTDIAAQSRTAKE